LWKIERVAAARALVLQHDLDTGPGFIGDWLLDRSIYADVVHVPERDELPDPSDYALVVSLGSEHSAAEELGWLLAEALLLRAAHTARIPLLGVCFGAQLLARALGGRVNRGAVSEVGWRTVRSRVPALVAEGPWLQWHFDTLEPPAHAELLAESEAGVEAFAWERSLGVQFHPEVSTEMVSEWARAGGSKLDAHGISPVSLAAECDQHAPAARVRAYTLLDAFAAHAGLDAPIPRSQRPAV
jgi:GMP synthase-like glutamine amidotransferase